MINNTSHQITLISCIFSFKHLWNFRLAVWLSGNSLVSQHIAREVEIFVVCTYKIFSGINWWKHFENQSTFAKVIIKHQVASFLGTQFR